MDSMYDRIDKLCKDNGTNITAVCRELKMQRSSFSELKAGRTKSIGADKIAKLADYFNVSALFITDGIENTEIKNPPGQQEPEDIAKVALFGGDKEVTDEMWDEVKNYVEYIKQKHSKD